MGDALLETAPAPQPERVNLLGATVQGLEQVCVELGEPAYRGRQLMRSIFKRRASGFDDLTDLPKAFRATLAEHCSLERPKVDAVQVSKDGTRKYRFLASDLNAWEAVYIPEVGKRGQGAAKRTTNTLCVSSQTGCAVGCKFCFTGSLRRARNLTSAEILSQLLAVQDDVAQLGEEARVTNIVFMGMGEPLLNYDNVIDACNILTHDLGPGLSTRRVTVSTAGIVPRIADLGRDTDVQLAVSLHAPTDEIRDRIMPINKKWPVAQLVAAMEAYPLAPRRRITIEYVLLAGVNDAPATAKKLVSVLSKVPVKLNLLPLNPHPATELQPPNAEAVERFAAELRKRNMNVVVRTPRGQDIDAACGQLGESAKLPPTS